MHTTFEITTQGHIMQKSSKSTQDAVAILTADHKEVAAKFKEFEGLGDRAFAAKKKLAAEICQALTEHMAAEEDIFYPAFHQAVPKSDDMVDEAVVEHAGAKDLIEQILGMSPEEELYDAKVHVLSEQIEHHVKEEEEEMFPKARKSDMDLVALGEQIEAMKEQLHGEVA
jgi:iron-sulfur cluster repair protein YtfE (RIC family)